MKEEWFDIVDTGGSPVGKATRTECHSGTKLLHPVVHVHVTDQEGRLLLQKRAADKKIQPGKWDTSVGGHIMAGEEVEAALSREVQEEIGITLDLELLRDVACYIYESDVEKEYIRSYLYQSCGPFAHQEEEIDQIAFFTVPEVENLIKENKTTPNFNFEFTNYLKKYINKEDKGR